MKQQITPRIPLSDVITGARAFYQAGNKAGAFQLAAIMRAFGLKTDWHDCADAIERLELKGEIVSTHEEDYPGSRIYVAK